MSAPGTIRIDPNAFNQTPSRRWPDSAAARVPRLRPIDTLAHHSNPPRCRFGPACWVVSLLAHAAAIVAVLTMVGPVEVEAPPPDAGVSMVFADLTPAEPLPPAEPPLSVMADQPLASVMPAQPPPPALTTADPSPDADPLPVPPQEPVPEPATASAPTPLEEPPPPPVPHAQPRQARPPVSRVRPAPQTTAPATRAEAPSSASAPRPETLSHAPIVPPRPVAGMEDNRPPRYPESARRRQEQGRVMVGVSVATDGTPIDTRIDTSSGHPALDEAAIEAVRRWRFVPGTQNDRPVVASAQVPIVFHLRD